MEDWDFQITWKAMITERLPSTDRVKSQLITGSNTLIGSTNPSENWKAYRHTRFELADHRKCLSNHAINRWILVNLFASIRAARVTE